MNRVAAGLLALAAVVCIALMKPSKPEVRKYRIGEQGEKGTGGWETALNDVIVAKVGGYAVSAGELMRVLDTLPPYQRKYYSVPEKVEVFLHNYLVMNLLAEEAKSQGLERDPYVRMMVEDSLAAAYQRRWLARNVLASDITEDHVEQWLKEHRLKQESQGEVGPDIAATAAKTAILEKRREEAWRKHVERLTKQIEQ